MKILYISPKPSFPPTLDGGKWRSFNQIRLLSQKHKVFSLSFARTKEEILQARGLEKFCTAEIVLLPERQRLLNMLVGLFSGRPLRVCYNSSKRMQQAVQRLLESECIDAIFIQGIRMAHFVPKSFSGKKLLDIVDCDSLQMARELRFSGKFWRQILTLELSRMRAFENKIADCFDRIIAASFPDAKAFSEKAIVLQNGEKGIKSSEKEKTEKNILFVGNYEYAPNRDAVKYFCKEIFPIVRKKHCDARFFAVGANPGREITRLSATGNNVFVTGFEENLTPFLENAAVFVAPMRFGSGIQNKVIDAMHAGTATVCSQIVNEGIMAKDGKEIMVAGTPEEFAAKICALLKNSALNKKISMNAKSFAEKNFNWEKIGKQLENIFES